MTEIKVETIHLGGTSDKGRMTIGKACLIVAQGKNRDDSWFEAAEWLATRAVCRTTGRKGGQPEQSRHEPGGAVACGLPVGTALSPVFAQCC